MKNSLKLKILPLDTTLAPDIIAYSSFDSSKVNNSLSYRWNKHLLTPKLRITHKFNLPTIDDRPPTPPTAMRTGENSVA